jgi:hypothetical protein
MGNAGTVDSAGIVDRVESAENILDEAIVDRAARVGRVESVERVGRAQSYVRDASRHCRFPN